MLKSELPKNPWSQNQEEILKSLNTSLEGLSTSESNARLKDLGPNSIPKKKRLSKLSIFLDQLKSPLIFILIIATLVTLALNEIKDAIVIGAAVLVNSFLGFYQENKAENSLDELKKYIKQKTVVVREGREVTIESSEVVPGDILSLFPGERIPADARVVYSKNLLLDEAILTGESLPVKKDIKPVKIDAPLGDKKSMVFGGTLVVEGLGKAVVVSTGKETTLGQIASMVESSKDELTPLQKSIKEFTIKLSIVLVALIAVLFGIGIYYGQDLVEMFITSVAIAVSAIPEGLPIALTVILAIGVERMAKRKGVVRKLLAAETLGSTTTIMTDKTGTLTESKTSLSQVIPMGKDSIKDVLVMASSTINVISNNKKEEEISGSSIEVSLAIGLKKYGLSYDKVQKEISIIDREPFNSKDKFSACLFEFKKKKYIAFLGAPDILLNLSKIDKENKKKIFSQIDELAYSGEKLVGLAIKETSKNEIQSEKISNLEFKALISFRDPVRKNVASAIKKVQNLGVKTIIVTGDHPGTAEAVAKSIGLFKNGDKLMVSTELSSLSDDELRKNLKDIKVFARVSPEQKLRIAKIYKQEGEIVAMTGDGINDAPALKEANIGIAVGSGTEVAKGASDLIILDDNFETIVAAIEEGRKTVGKIKKVLVYLLSSIVDELILIGGALLTGLTIPLNALQILWVNFFSDSFPALGLAFEDKLAESSKKPSNIKNNLLDEESKFIIMVIGTLTSLLLFAVYYTLLKMGFEEKLVRTFIFASFGLYSLFLVFSIRSLKKSILTYNIFDNEFLSAGVGFGVILMALAIYLPLFQSVLDTVPLSPIWVGGVFAISLINIIAVEFAKWLYRNKD